LKIKVLNVLIDNWIGGIQNRILMIVPKLKLNEINTIILVPRGYGNFYEIAKKAGLTTFQSYIESPKYFSSLQGLRKNIFWFLTFPIAVLQIVRLIRREDIDIVHVNGLLALQPVLAARITNRPIIWHLISTLYPKSLVLILRPIIRYSSCRHVFVTKKTIQYYLGKNYSKEKIDVIFEPVDIDYYDSNKLSNNFKIMIKEKLGIPDSNKVIGFVGNITPQKGLEYFIKVAGEIKKHYTNVTYLIIGGVSEGHKTHFEKLNDQIIKSNLEKEILFIGRVPDIREYLGIMDIFLMTSISEGTPLVILEAMAMEIPTVATNVGGVSEQIIEGETGILVQPRDVKGISEAIIYLLKNDKISKEMGKKGRHQVEQLFSLEKCVQGHKNIYKDVYEQ